MQNTQVKIGQAVVACVAIDDRSNELEFTWVQEHRGFDSLIGQAMEYNAFQHRSKIRLGDKTKGDRQAITFDPTNNDEEMEDGKEYAVLIRWNPESGKDPEILGFDDKNIFDSVVAELKARKNAYVQYEPREKVPDKKRFSLSVVQEVDDPNTYRVVTMNRRCSGRLKDIVVKLANEIEGDPTEMLNIGSWFKKGPDNKYSPCAMPKIPPAPAMLLTALQKAASA